MKQTRSPVILRRSPAILRRSPVILSAAKDDMGRQVCNSLLYWKSSPLLAYIRGWTSKKAKAKEQEPMILHMGERVYWGAPEVIYLEGTILQLNEENQTVVVHIDRATPNSAHLIGADVPFAANGVTPLQGDSPAGTTTEPNTDRQSSQPMSDEEKVRSAAAAAVHQRYGTTLTGKEREHMIEQVARVLNSDSEMRARIIASMNQILQREK
jgi:hypothetical protein